MKTIEEYITTDEKKNKEIFERAHEVLKNGGLVAFPTETVYGLGADAMNPEACRRIYEAKGRPSDNPLIVHAKDSAAAGKVAEFDEKAQTLADCFWPGPLTLVLKRRSCVPDAVTGGLDTVAVRVPGHLTARGLLKTSDMFIAAPSANISGKPSPTEAAHVLKDLDGHIDMVIVDDSVNVGLESTILDMTSDPPAILRPGAVTREQIEAVLGELIRAPKNSVSESEPGDAPKAPGMKYRHYAPEAELFLIYGNKERAADLIQKLADEASAMGKKTFVLASSQTAGEYKSAEVIDLGNNAFEASAQLFKALRRCDEEGAQVIISEGFEEKGMGRALMNRLIKAAGNNIIRV